MPTLAVLHSTMDPVGRIVLALAIILTGAAALGRLASRLGQPAVLGELVAGIIIGNLGLLGITGLGFISREPVVAALAQIGALILLFQVGLEATVNQMLKVGAVALAVALLGVTASFAFGWLVGLWLLPDAEPLARVFLGAALCATSVGITARVLKDTGAAQRVEARIILGAAVIDDVLSLVILSVVAGVIGAADQGVGLGSGAAVMVVLKAALFLVGAIAVGRWTAARLFLLASRLRARGTLLITALAFCFALAWIAGLMGLAPIVGAFAAGLVLERSHAAPFTRRGEKGIEDRLAPLGGLLIPVFFVLMGAHADLAALARPGVIGLAAALTAAAILGKQACALGARQSGANRLAVAIGMIPRGEVQLIFASMGVSLTVGGMPVISPSTYAALVVTVVVTTLITPPALTWALGRGEPGRKS
ncbi:MAG: cation:proton antiporter [Gemmatimonadales bacterium]